MPETEPTDILAHAMEHEKRYDWIIAVEFHEEVLVHSSRKKDLLGAGGIEERIGYCFYRAAMQAKTRDEFEKKMKLALGAYQRAQGFYEALPVQQKGGSGLRSRAVVTYLGYWFASNGVERRKLLDECLELEEKALTRFELDGNMLEYCRTYNMLWPVFFLRGFLEWDGQVLLRLIDRGMEWGKKAISVLSEADNPYELVWASFTFATCLTFVASWFVGVFLVDHDEMDKNRSEVIAILEKALALSEKTDDALLKGLLHLWLGFTKDRVADSRSNCEKALNLGEIAGDNFLVGASSELLAYDMVWQATGDFTRRWELIEAAVKAHDKALRHNSIAHFQSPMAGPINGPWGRAAYYFERATKWETYSEERLSLLNMAENAGIEALKVARGSGMPGVIGGALHTLSKILTERARLDSDLAEKRNRLKMAIEYREESVNIHGRLNPFNYFDYGLLWSYLAETKAKLAEIESNSHEKNRLLQEAVMHKEQSLELCIKVIPYYEKIGNFDYLPVLGEILDRCATMLTNLHDLTKESDDLKRAIELLAMAIKSAKKQEMITFEGELYWRIAKAQDTLEEYSAAAENFELASESYLKGAERYPQLKDFYESHAFYMQAWREIERAKQAHVGEQYGLANNHYQKAAALHESATHWSYLSFNYSAWAKLEEAEELSRSEKAKEAKENFLRAVELFKEAGKRIQSKLETPLSGEEKELAGTLAKASERRREYCLGRIALEEAKIQDREGDHLQSSKKYGLAAKIFARIAENEDEQSHRQLLSISFLCQAWGRMMMGEETTSSKAYEEAAELFNQAREHSLDQKTSLLALANSCFCKALASGTEFEITRDLTAYSDAKKHMEAAENYFLKAGLGPASEYAKATLELMDAYMYITKAETETEPADKAKYYNIAGRTLKTSLDSYLRAKHPEKSDEVQKLLENISEKRQLASSLMAVLPESSITAATTLFSVPIPTREEAVGFERFAHAELEANLTIPEEANVEEQIEVKLDIVNVGRQAGLLLRVQGLIPLGFKVASSGQQYYIAGDFIDIKGERIEPLKVYSLQLSMRTLEIGMFDLRPKISYVDEVGDFKQCIPKSATITVYPKIELEFRTDAARKVFEHLIKSFVEDYMRRKIVLQESGWRSFVQTMKNAKVSSRTVYGKTGMHGSAISELERRGLIETRIFPGERGRGGEIVKARICYEKEVVKRLVDRKVAKNE